MVNREVLHDTSEKKPVILVVSHVVPYPPAAGNEIRILKMVNWLKSQGFAIALLLNHDPLPSDRQAQLEKVVDRVHFIDDEYGDELKPLPKQQRKLNEVVSALLGDSALHRLVFGQDRQGKIKSDGVKKWLASDRLIQATEYLCRRYAPVAVLAEYIFAAPCLDVVPNGVLKIIDTHDMFSRKKEQVLAYGIDDPLPCTRREERSYLLKSDLVIAIQSNEARMFGGMVMERDVITVGIDFDVVEKVDNSAVVPGTILIVGSDNPLNVHGLREFVANAWPTVRAGYPGVMLRVVGKLANHLQTDDERVQLAGWVLDLDEEYRKAAVVINPTLAGTGLKIKSVEALCRAKPFVGTPNSMEGIDYTGEAPFIVCRDWREFSESVVSLLRSEEERTCLQRRALEFARVSFSSDRIYLQLGARLATFINSCTQQLLSHEGNNMTIVKNREEQLKLDLSQWPELITKLIDSGNMRANSVLYSYREFVQRGEFDHLDMFVDPTKVSIDVGTNNGQYAMKLAIISKACLCLEPVRALSYVKELLPANCIYMSVAAGRHAGTASLRIPKNNEHMDYAQSTLSPDNSLCGNPFEEQVTEVSTIDQLVSEVFPDETVGFIKIDVEGFEDAVLEGAIETLRKSRPNLKIELHGNKKIDVVCKYLYGLGYRGLFFFNGKIHDGSIFDTKIHRAPENEYNWRKSRRLDFDPSKYVCDFFFIPIAD